MCRQAEDGLLGAPRDLATARVRGEQGEFAGAPPRSPDVVADIAQRRGAQQDLLSADLG